MGEVIEYKPNNLVLDEPLKATNGYIRPRFRNITTKKDDLNSTLEFIIDYDEGFVLEDSYFIFDMDLVKHGGGRFADDAEVTFSNNAPMFLFERVSLKIDDLTIEDYRIPGIVTTVSGLLKFSFSSQHSMQQCWRLDRGDFAANSTTNSGFKRRQEHVFLHRTYNGVGYFIVPFTHIFGSPGKLLYGNKITVTMYRSQSADNAIFRSDTKVGGSGGDKDDPKFRANITLHDAIFRLAGPELSLTRKTELLEYFRTDPTIYMEFPIKRLETWPVHSSTTFTQTIIMDDAVKLEGLVLCFQTNRKDNQERNMSAFDHVNLKEARVEFDGNIYPGYDMKNQVDKYAIPYHLYTEFQKRFSTEPPAITEYEFRTNYAIYCFDFTYQKPSIDTRFKKLQIVVEFTTNPAAGTHCYAVVFSKKIVTFQPDGGVNPKVRAIQV